MKRVNLSTMFLCAMAVAMVAGCKQETSTPIEAVTTSLLTYQPKGTITGLIRNRIAGIPVSGAVISLGYDGGVQSTTSDDAGAYSFANVPVGQYQIVNGTSVATGTYTFTVSLVKYNSGQTTTSTKYRDYYFSTVTIKFTSLSPGDSLAPVSDMVGSSVLDISYLNTSLVGQVVDRNLQPLASATVMLFDATVNPNVLIGQTSSSATGMYQFNNIDNGLSVIVKSRSADGTLDGTLGAFTLPANVVYDSVRTQVTAERLVLTPSDNVSPFVIGISPENNADVSPTNLNVVYAFSEPIKQTAYTRTDLPKGQNTVIDDITVTYVGLKKTAGPITFSASWNAAFTQLTIVPQGLVGSAKYTVSLVNAMNSGKLTDNANRAVVNDTSITGDFEPLAFTTAGASTVPSAPTLVRRYISGVYADLDFNGGTVGLEWNFDANARSYNIYRSIDGGTFDLLQANFYGTQLADNTGALVVPSSANDPLRAANVRYLVRAQSKDLVESASSNTITVVDAVKPKLFNATEAAGVGTNAWIYTAQFTEPMVISTAENGSNYSFANTSGVTFTINSASYLGYSGGHYFVQLGVTTSAALPVGYILVVASAVTDLAGNGTDQTANSKTF